jgi:hypothetical protein
MPMTEKQLGALARDLRRALARVAPEWTGHKLHDPGTTILEVISYTLEELRYHGGASAGHSGELSRTRAPEVSGESDDCGVGLQRVNYVTGMLLGVDEFRAEQDYVRDRLKRRNRLLHGAGIAAGLGVTVKQHSSGSRITIEPGLALDRSGNEICVEQPADLALPAHAKDIFVLLCYHERPCRSVPVVPSSAVEPSDRSAAGRPTRITETFNVALAAAPTADGVAIARLRQARGRWRVDRNFEVMRVG